MGAFCAASRKKVVKLNYFFNYKCSIKLSVKLFSENISSTKLKK